MDQDLGRFLDYLRAEAGVSPHTLHAYRRDVSAFLDALRRKERVRTTAEATAEHVHRHVRRLLASHRPTSVARAVAAIRGFFRFLHGDGLLPSDPAAEILPPALERTLPPVLLRRQVDRLLEAVEGDSPMALRNRALLEVLYATGARVSEATGLRLGSYEGELAVLRLLGKGRRERLVPLSPRAVDRIQAYLRGGRPRLAARRPDEDHLFVSRTGRPLDRIRVFRVLRAVGRAAGIPVPVHPHLMRHCFATHLVAGGADLRSVQEMLGHASLATTQIYTQVDHERLREVHSRFHPRG